MQKALLLHEPREISGTRKLENVLAAFGVECRKVSVTEFLAATVASDGGSEIRLLGSAATFLKLFKSLEEDSAASSGWRKNVQRLIPLPPVTQNVVTGRAGRCRT